MVPSTSSLQAFETEISNTARWNIESKRFNKYGIIIIIIIIKLRMAFFQVKRTFSYYWLTVQDINNIRAQYGQYWLVA